MNINDTVRVRLTNAGRNLLLEHYSLGQMPGEAELSANLLKPGWLGGWPEFPLWELMQIFGPHIYRGMVDLLFADNEIILGAQTIAPASAPETSAPGGLKRRRSAKKDGDHDRPRSPALGSPTAP